MAKSPSGKHAHNFKDLTGQFFGRLIAIKPHHIGQHKDTYWVCQCECGREIIIRRGALLSGNTRSCGCLRSIQPNHRFKDLTGQKFDRLIVIGRDINDRWGRARWICECDCSNIVTVAAGMLVSGNTRSCGCFHKERKPSQQSLLLY